MDEGRLPLVGRDDELAILGRAHQEATEGPGRLVLLSAEAGGGKTELAQEFLRRLPGGVPVGRGGAVALGDRVMPLLPWRTALTDLARGQDRGVDGHGAASLRADHEQVVEVMLDRLTSATAGTVLLIEDLHWADDASLAMLSVLAAQLPTVPALIICTLRSGETMTEPLATVITELGRLDGVTRVELGGLTRAEIAELSAIRHDEPIDQLALDRLVERTGGNPFFVIESLDDPDGDELPLPVEDRLSRRLHQLPSSVLELVTIVAVTGPVPTDSLRTLTPSPDREPDVLPDAIRAAVQAGVLRVMESPAGEDMVSFRHALLAEAARRRVLPGQARALHRRMATELDNRATLATEEPDLDRLARLAHHWRLAAEPEQAFRSAMAAADRASADGYLAVTVENLTTALDLWSVVADPAAVAGRDRARVLLDASDAAVEVGRSDDAVRLAAVALEEATTVAGRAEAAWKVGYARYSARDLDGAHRFLVDESARVIDEAPDLRIARLLVATIGMGMSIGRYEVGIDCDPRIVAMVDHLQDPQLTGWLRSFRGACLATGADSATGLAMMDSAIEPLTEAGDFGYVLNTILNRTVAAFVVEPVEMLLDRAERAADFMADGPAYRALALAGLSSELLNYAGRTEEAWAVFEGGSTRLAWRTAAERAITLGLLALEAGDVERAKRLARSTDVAASRHNPPMALRADLLRARLQALDDPGRAGRRLVRQVAEANPVSAGLHGALALTYAWVWLDERGRNGEEFTETAARLLRLPAAAVSPVGVWQRLLAAQLNHEDPLAWDDAITAATDGGLPEVEARALLCAASALPTDSATAGSSSRIDRAERAAAIGARIGNRVVQRAAEEMLQRSGRADTIDTLDAVGSGVEARDDSLDPDRLANRHGLTPREREVLGLVADGCTNAEIGSRLYISAKTASVHVSNLIRKLGVANRREAARLARRHGLG